MAVLIPVAQGCWGVTGPVALSRSERAAVETARFDSRLGVEGQRRLLRVENGRRIYGDEDEHRDGCSPARTAARMYDQLGLAIAMKGDEILALAGQRGRTTKRGGANQLRREISGPVRLAQCATGAGQTR